MLLKEFFGLATIVVGLIGFIPYVWTALKGKTKPHAFSWLVWGLISIIAFVGQLMHGAGAGSWATGLGAFACLINMCLGLRWRSYNIARWDWVALLAALSAIPLWYFTADALPAMIVVCTINALGCFPTFRKSFYQPYDEHRLLYFTNMVKFIFALLAIENYDTVTVLFPLTALACNGSILSLLTVRRFFVPRASLLDDTQPDELDRLSSINAVV